MSKVIQKEAVEPFDGVAVAGQTPIQTPNQIPNQTPNQTPKHHSIWGSVRLTYTLCAFLSMVLHICMRNTLNLVILCMVKESPDEASGAASMLKVEPDCRTAISLDTAEKVEKTGDLTWTRSQQFTLQGTFYYGYMVSLPVAGILSDKFGGKAFFVHSMIAEAAIFMLTPALSKISYNMAVVARTVQGLISGCSNPCLYQLFTTWAHPTERTALLSFAYGGYAVGVLITFPLSTFLCNFGWETSFYCIGIVSIITGIAFQWLVYNSIETHPRISPEEAVYLQSTQQQKVKESSAVPWKSILTSVPVIAFALTHICHTYGIMMFTIMAPRFLKESMGFTLSEAGILSAIPFFGALVSRVITVSACSAIERRPNLDITIFRRFFYVFCNLISMSAILGMILATCHHRALVVLLTALYGIMSDLSFAGGYWPSMLYVAPTYAGLLSGIANCLATATGFLVPVAVSYVVVQGTKLEWDYIMVTLIVTYGLGACVYGIFGSSKLQPWDQKKSTAT